MKRNNITDALDLISRVNHNNPCYTKAKTMQADILLKYRRDRYAYIAIYQDIIKEKSDSDSYVLLGDAYMNILGKTLTFGRYFFISHRIFPFQSLTVHLTAMKKPLSKILKIQI